MVDRMVWARAVVAAVGIVALAYDARAQGFPNWPIRDSGRIPCGGPSDIPAASSPRSCRLRWASRWWWRQDRAAGMIAVNDMLAQPRDGHTLLLCSYLDASNMLLTRTSPTSWRTWRRSVWCPRPLRVHRADSAAREHGCRSSSPTPRRGLASSNYGRVGSGSATELLAEQLAEGGRHLHGRRAVSGHRPRAAGSDGGPAGVHDWPVGAEPAAA